MIVPGKHNPRLADVRKAIAGSGLTRDHLLPIEGPKLIREACGSGLEVEVLFVREGASTGGLAEEFTDRCKTYVLEASQFKSIQGTTHSQGVIALVRPRIWTLSDVVARSPAPIVVLAGLQDPGNVGTVLRLAESFDAAGCIGLSGTAEIYNSKVVRASAGSVFRLPHAWHVAWPSLEKELRACSIPLAGTSPHAAAVLTSWDWRAPVAVLIGNEGSGLAPELTEKCAAMLRIPHNPRVESLNSAIAAAVILYESYCRRNPQ